MGYQMKRGAAPKFKELGSSPVKQDYHEALDHWKEYKAGKVKKDIHLERKKNFDKFQAQKQKGKEFVKNLYKPGATDATKTIGDKNTLKGELKKGVKRFVESAKGQWKGFKAPKISSKIVKVATEAGKVARFAGKASGVGLVGEGLYQAYKSGQKHSKGKAVKGQKTGIVTPDKSKSIWKK